MTFFDRIIQRANLRLLVMSGGQLAGEVDAKNTSQEEILTLAAKYV